MFKNNLKIAWRNLLRDRQFTFLNLIGLATGLACVLLIYLWVADETSVDKFQKNDAQLYQVMQYAPLDDGGIMTTEHTPDLLANSLAAEMPEVENAVIIKSPDEDGNSRVYSLLMGPALRRGNYM